MTDLVTFVESDAKSLIDGIRNRPGKVIQSSNVRGQQYLQIARLTAEIAASTNGSLTSGTGQLFTFDPTATSPVALSSTGLTTVTLWSGFEEVLPQDTYVIVGKIIGGYIIIQPLNYCPA